MKKNLLYIGLSLTISAMTSCQNSVPNSDDFSIKGTSDISTPDKNVPLAKESTKPPIPDFLTPPQNEKVEVFKKDKSVSPKEKPQFDNVIPVTEIDDAVPGSVTVIYKNNGRFRINKANASITALDKTDEIAIEKILTQNKIKSVDDVAYPNVTEEQLNDDVEKVSREYGIEAPHRKSIHIYRFPNSANTKEIAEQLRKLPYVRSAYMTPKVILSATVTPDLSPETAPPRTLVLAHRLF